MKLTDNIFIGYVDNYITDGLITILNELKNNNEGIPFNSSCTVDGFQTNNLINQDNIKPYLKYIMTLLPSNKLKHRWFHMIDYNISGYQKEHTHENTEKYSYIIYLENSASGETYFKITDKNTMYIKPIKNMIIFFPSYIKHGSLQITDNKKIAVGALT